MGTNGVNMLNLRKKKNRFTSWKLFFPKKKQELGLEKNGERGMQFPFFSSRQWHTVQSSFKSSNHRLVRYKKLHIVHAHTFFDRGQWHSIGSGGSHTYITPMRGLECSGSKTPPLTDWNLTVAWESLGDPRRGLSCGGNVAQVLMGRPLNTNGCSTTASGTCRTEPPTQRQEDGQGGRRPTLASVY